MASETKVLILMGSAGDYKTMKAAAKVLDELDIGYEITVASAHRTPERTTRMAREAAERGVQIVIAGAGLAAHLAGVLAAETNLPVLGVPIEAGPLDGLDALLSTVQMPGGTPVATLGIGKAGAKNAGALAARILALSDETLASKLAKRKQEMAEKVTRDAAEVEEMARSERAGPEG